MYVLLVPTNLKLCAKEAYPDFQDKADPLGSAPYSMNVYITHYTTETKPTNQ